MYEAQQQRTETANGVRLPGWLLALLPLLLLAILIGAFAALDPLQFLMGNPPLLENLSLQRVELRPGAFIVHVINGGPDPVTVAQVLVDEAYWAFEIEPSASVPRLGHATLTIPYPWVEGEAHDIRLITSTGMTFEKTIETALETPQPDARFWGVFALLGFYVGIVPVGLGLMWFPLLKRLTPRGMNFVLALTVGLLVFLLVDTVLEGLEIAEQVPDVFQAAPLVFLAGLLAFLLLIVVERQQAGSHRATTTSPGRLWLATMIALGIGLHNLGEGMAIGASIALGEAALGSFLVIGFTLHNITEGVAIGAPMARDKPRLARLIGLVLVAGGPALVGTWIGGFSFSPLVAVIFLAIGAGAILQVVYEVGRWLTAEIASERQSAASWVSVGGLTLGILIMYLTALLVTT